MPYKKKKGKFHWDPLNGPKWCRDTKFQRNPSKADRERRVPKEAKKGSILDPQKPPCALNIAPIPNMTTDSGVLANCAQGNLFLAQSTHNSFLSTES